VNELVLKEFSGDHIIYLYTPEGKGEPGSIIFDIATGEAAVAESAQNDEFGRYGHNAARRIKEYAEKKNLPMNAIQAWY